MLLCLYIAMPYIHTIDWVKPPVVWGASLEVVDKAVLGAHNDVNVDDDDTTARRWQLWHTACLLAEETYDLQLEHDAARK